MSLTKAQQSIIAAIVPNNLFAADKIAQENIAFEKPTDGSPWTLLKFMPNDPVVSTLGPNGLDYVTGIIQADLHYPVGQGTADITAKAEAFKNVFTAGRRFAYEGQEAVVISCGRSQGIPAEGDFVMPVSIYFYCHVQRNQ